MSLAPLGWRHWLTARFFFALLLISAVALAFFFGWHARFDDWPGPRLHLNLALAWVPYLCSLWAVASVERGTGSLRPMLIPGVVWLVFFPNAPYLITDWLYVEHLSDHIWYSIAMFTVFSTAGLLLAIVSLYLMHTLVRVHLGRAAGCLVVGLAIGLSGLGVYLGRFLRLNSWDLITRPGAVIDDLAHLSAQENHAGPVSFTIMFTSLLLVGYLVFLSVRRAPRSREEKFLARS
jgi:uncharacterized membrane protein